MRILDVSGWLRAHETEAVASLRRQQTVGIRISPVQDAYAEFGRQLYDIAITQVVQQWINQQCATLMIGRTSGLAPDKDETKTRRD
jgi:predicted TIM-barrel enzyme